MMTTAEAIAALTGRVAYQPAERAIRHLINHPDPAAHDVLVAAYHKFERKDGMGTLRALILTALRPIVTQADLPLLEHALATYQITNQPFNPDYMVAVRAAALYTLNDIDDQQAAWYATRFLVEPYSSKTSGEPALTAARVLASQGNVLPLYQFVLTVDEHGFYRAVAAEVIAECLSHLHMLPQHLLDHLLGKLYPADDDIVMLGLLDLLIKVRPLNHVLNRLLHFIHESDRIDLFDYFVQTVAAGRDVDLIKRLLPELQLVENSDKMAIVAAAEPYLSALIEP